MLRLVVETAKSRGQEDGIHGLATRGSSAMEVTARSLHLRNNMGHFCAVQAWVLLFNPVDFTMLYYALSFSMNHPIKSLIHASCR